MSQRKNKPGCLAVLVWPFTALWVFVATIIKLAGRLVALLLGVVLMIVGILLTVTVIGAVVGVPLVALGLLLIARSLF